MVEESLNHKCILQLETLNRCFEGSLIIQLQTSFMTALRDIMTSLMYFLSCSGDSDLHNNEYKVSVKATSLDLEQKKFKSPSSSFLMRATATSKAI